jgi:hypothetical protein
MSRAGVLLGQLWGALAGEFKALPGKRMPREILRLHSQTRCAQDDKLLDATY